MHCGRASVGYRGKREQKVTLDCVCEVLMRSVY